MSYVQKDTCELWLNEGWVKLVHLSSPTIQEHNVDNVIPYVPLPFHLHNTKTHLSLQSIESVELGGQSLAFHDGRLISFPGHST
jgi:hypothetical protein